MKQTKEELIKENAVLKEQHIKIQTEQHNLKIGYDELEKENKSILERERTFMVNVIAQQFAKQDERHDQNGKKYKCFVTPNLDCEPAKNRVFEHNYR